MSAKRKKDEAVSTDEKDRTDSLFEIEDGTLVRFDDGAYVTRFKGALPAVYVPASATRVGEKAFALSHVESVRFLGDVEAIGSEAFSGCESLRDIVIPDTVSEIGESAFYGCESLESIEILGEVEEIGPETFAYCSALRTVTLPGSLRRVGDDVLRGCAALKTLRISDGAKDVELECFCSIGVRGERLILPKSLENIAPAIFSAFDFVELDPENKAYKVEDGGIYSADGKTFVTACDRTVKTFSVALGVERIGERAFYSCHNLSSVTLRDGLETIGDNAFCACSDLRTIDILGSVTALGHGVFSDCIRIERLSLPAGLKTIGGSAFDRCLSLKSMDIPAGATFEGDHFVFCGCESLQSVTLPNGLEEIGEHMFRGCSNLASLDIPSTVTKIDEEAFAFCSSLEKITLPEGLKSVEWCAFYGCKRLTSVRIPASVSLIGCGAFRECSKLKEVDFEDPCGWAYTKGESKYGDNPEYVAVDSNTLRGKRRACRFLKGLHRKCVGGGLEKRG